MIEYLKVRVFIQFVKRPQFKTQDELIKKYNIINHTKTLSFIYGEMTQANIDKAKEHSNCYSVEVLSEIYYQSVINIFNYNQKHLRSL